MIFDSPQWDWKISYDPQTFGYVSNRVAVSPAKGADYHVLVSVPAALLTLLDTLIPKSTRENLKENPVLLYLEQVGERWFFGYEVAGEEPVDLWYYTKSTLPVWAEKRR